MLITEMKEYILREELSISNEVQEASEKIYNDIQSVFIKYVKNNPQSKSEYIGDRQYFFNINYNDNERIFNTINRIKVIAIDFLNIEEFTTTYPKTNYDSDYQSFPQTNNFIIEVVLPAFNGIINEEYAIRVLSHELLHAYQDSKIHFMTRQINYNIAQKLQNASSNQSVISFCKLFYLIDRKEIEANMHSLYNELIKKKLDSYEDSYVYNKIDKLIKVYMEYINNIDRNGIIELESEFKIPYDKLLNIINKNIEYFYYRVGKIFTNYKLYMNKVFKNINEEMKYLVGRLML